MSFIRFFLSEIRYRKTGFISNILVVVLAVTALSVILRISDASKRSIQLITKNMGQNVMLIHEDTDLEAYYGATGGELLMPQAFLDSVSTMEEVVTTYQVGVLQKRGPFSGVEAVLTGALAVKGARASEGKKNPFTDVEKGSVRLGSEIAAKTGLKAGATVEFLDAPYRVAEVEEEKGTMDDYRVYVPLKDLQYALNLQGKITAILSLECLCSGEPLSITEARIKKTIQAVLPEVKVVTMRSIALARYEAREVTEQYNRIILALLLTAAVLFIIIQSYSEALKRQKESALMSALGFKGNTAVRLYLAKALVVAVSGVLIGYGLGQKTALAVGPIFAKAKVNADWTGLPWFLAAATLAVALSFMPALVRSLRSDPFELLREE